MNFLAMLIRKGGAGSGNFNHAGRPGKVGGSAKNGVAAPRMSSLVESELAKLSGDEYRQALSIAENLVATQEKYSGHVVFTEDNEKLADMLNMDGMTSDRRRQYLGLLGSFTEMEFDISDSYSLLMSFGDVDSFNFDALLKLKERMPLSQAMSWVSKGFFADETSAREGELALAAGMLPQDAAAIKTSGGLIEDYLRYKDEGRGDVASFYYAVSGNSTESRSAASRLSKVFDGEKVTIRDLKNNLELFGGVNAEGVNNLYAMTELTGDSVGNAIRVANTAIANDLTVGDVLNLSRNVFTDDEVGDGFATYTTKISPRKYNRQYSDFDNEMTGGVTFVGAVRDEDHRQDVGTFQRTIKRMDDGSLVVGHDVLELSKSVQGAGFASDYYRTIESDYAERGVSKIRIHADLGVGGYAWARMGYDFASDKVARLVTKDFVDKHTEAYGKPPTPPKRTRWSGTWHSWDIASYIAPDETRFGKKFMLGSNWYGEKVIDKNNMGWKVGEEYYKAKGY